MTTMEHTRGSALFVTAPEPDEEGKRRINTATVRLDYDGDLVVEDYAQLDAAPVIAAAILATAGATDYRVVDMRDLPEVSRLDSGGTTYWSADPISCTLGNIDEGMPMERVRSWLALLLEAEKPRHDPQDVQILAQALSDADGGGMDWSYFRSDAVKALDALATAKAAR